MKPPLGKYKCNVDASSSTSKNKVGIGICIKDDQGHFVLARTEWFLPCIDMHIGEATGLLHVLQWVQELGLNDIDFELDSKFNSKGEDISELGAIIHNCRHIYNSYFTNSCVEFPMRQTNEVAHSLAKAVTSHDSFHIFSIIITRVCKKVN